MKAIVQRDYGSPGDVIEFRDMDRSEPRDGEVLVRVRASSVNAADWLTLVGHPYVMRLAFGVRRPKYPIPGKDVAGIVEDVGPGVTRWAVGDEVYGELTAGAYAEFVVASQDVLARKPVGLDFAQAAAVPLAGVTALQGLRDAGKGGIRGLSAPSPPRTPAAMPDAASAAPHRHAPSAARERFGPADGPNELIFDSTGD